MPQRFLLIFFLLGIPVGVFAETVVATTLIRSGTILTHAHLAVISSDYPGAVTGINVLLGQEARVNLYPNRPVRLQDVGAPRVIDRNDLVTLVYRKGGLSIEAEGRSLGIGGVGDMLRAMNLGSRNTVQGVVVSPGVIHVRGGH